MPIHAISFSFGASGTKVYPDASGHVVLNVVGGGSPPPTLTVNPEPLVYATSSQIVVAPTTVNYNGVPTSLPEYSFLYPAVPQGKQRYFAVVIDYSDPSFIAYSVLLGQITDTGFATPTPTIDEDTQRLVSYLLVGYNGLVLVSGVRTILHPNTGQSTVDGMTQKAITDEFDRYQEIPVETTGTDIKFDRNRNYGEFNPIGDFTLNLAGAKRERTATVWSYGHSIRPAALNGDNIFLDPRYEPVYDNTKMLMIMIRHVNNDMIIPTVMQVNMPQLL